MARSKSRIWTDLDFEKNGKQVGNLHTAWSISSTTRCGNRPRSAIAPRAS